MCFLTFAFLKWVLEDQILRLVDQSSERGQRGTSSLTLHACFLNSFQQGEAIERKKRKEERKTIRKQEDRCTSGHQINTQEEGYQTTTSQREIVDFNEDELRSSLRSDQSNQTCLGLLPRLRRILSSITAFPQV
jgi:hypothetical protein